MTPRSREKHRAGRTGWLRAAVLGANDGILSTSSLLLGIAAAHSAHSNIMIAGTAALAAHARDELGLSETNRSRPIQAALASAASFASGAALPLLVAAIAPAANLVPFIAGTSVVFLAILGGLAARAGGAGVLTGATRVTVWGALAMAITAGIGALFGTST